MQIPLPSTKGSHQKHKSLQAESMSNKLARIHTLFRWCAAVKTSLRLCQAMVINCGESRKEGAKALSKDLQHTFVSVLKFVQEAHFITDRFTRPPSPYNCERFGGGWRRTWRYPSRWQLLRETFSTHLWALWRWFEKDIKVPSAPAVAAGDLLVTFVSALEVVGEEHVCIVPYLAHRAVAARDFLDTFVSALEVVGEAHVCTLPGRQGSCCGRLSRHICERPGGGWGDTCRTGDSGSSCSVHPPALQINIEQKIAENFWTSKAKRAGWLLFTKLKSYTVWFEAGVYNIQLGHRSNCAKILLAFINWINAKRANRSV
jgi:hypothetical protein